MLAGTVQEKLEALKAAHLIFWPKKQGGTPRPKWYWMSSPAVRCRMSGRNSAHLGLRGSGWIPDAKARGPS